MARAAFYSPLWVNGSYKHLTQKKAKNNMFCVIYINIKYQSKISKCIIMSINVSSCNSRGSFNTNNTFTHSYNKSLSKNVFRNYNDFVYDIYYIAKSIGTPSNEQV